MLLSANSIRDAAIINPCVEKTIHRGMSYGLSHAGYDIRIKQAMALAKGDFALSSTMEYFIMPKDILGIVKNKSSWARQGLNVFETVIEPGWQGYLTLEMVCHSQRLFIGAGDPIAQVLFFQVDAPTIGYTGKYQDQINAPQPFIYEP